MIQSIINRVQHSRLAALCAGATVLLLCSFAVAGQPEPMQLMMQPAGSPVKAEFIAFHDELLIIMSIIAALVLVLLIYVMLRFNAKRNPKPATFTHHVWLEVIWIGIPALIVLAIGYRSMGVLYFADKHPDPAMTLKVVGHQWYWSYEYPDHQNISFDSYMIPDNEINAAAGQLRLLSVDNPVVLPTNVPVRVYIASQDVIHSWAVPALGIKKDSVPGRLNETWLEISQAGRYYGQCSEICGIQHGFMPIEIIAVSQPLFDRWAQLAQQDLKAAYQWLSLEAEVKAITPPAGDVVRPNLF